jgi:hypothetical protein
MRQARGAFFAAAPIAVHLAARAVRPGSRSEVLDPRKQRMPTDALEPGQRAVPVLSRVRQRTRLTMWLALAAALAYSSWPLAFLVNPALAGSALASSFEGRSQPFSWLFILLDCIVGVCAAVVCICELLPRRGRQRPGRALVLALLGYGTFGMATAVDAVVPLTCSSTSAQACASQLWPLTPDDCLTGLAMLALFVAAAAAAAQTARRPLAFPAALPAAITIALIGWSTLGLVVPLGIAASTAAVCQYAFLTLTSILAFVIPLSATSAQDADQRARP